MTHRTDDFMNGVRPDDMRCPTCGARQTWADVCRRCKCDLRLLRAAVRTYDRRRASCLAHLHAGRGEPALADAIACHQLDPGDDSSTLLALSHLVRGSWLDALNAARGRSASAPK